MVQGFIPQVPVFRTPEQGTIQDLSPLLSGSLENGEKRLRQASQEGSSIVLATSEANGGEVFTLSDVMNALSKVSTKEDIVQIKGTLVAQSAEIQQLRGELDKHSERLKTLEEQVGKRAADDMHRTQPRPEGEGARSKQYGGTHEEAQDRHRRRRSVVIHGLNQKEENDLVEACLIFVKP